MGKWKKFWNFSGAERGLLFQALVLLPATAVALRLVGFRRWQAALARLAPAVPTDPRGNGLERAHQIARMVAAGGHHGPRRSSCLEESLVLWWLLRRQGFSPGLCVGARKRDGRFEAHAWVELAGAVLNDTGEVHRHYTPFDQSIVTAQAGPR